MNDIDKQVSVVDGDTPQEDINKEEYVPQYRMVSDAAIPVSKRLGSMWHTRQKEGIATLKANGDYESWEEAIEYYKKDQTHREGRKSSLDTANTGTDLQDKTSYASENIIFSNISALVPSIYAKNPDIEITANEENEAKAKMFERLVDTLLVRKVDPGLNIKGPMKKATIMALLTNNAYLDLSYTRKQDSSEETLNELQELSTAYKDAKTVDEIKEIEGKLEALQEKIVLINGEGPKIRSRHPAMVVGDPDRPNDDICSGRYIIVGEYASTAYLNAIYTQEDDDGNLVSTYKPSHVLKTSDDVGADDVSDDINNFTLLAEDSTHSELGFDTEKDMIAAGRTLTWTVYDKTTRRVLLFIDSDWKWPIWVWDDPYKLSRFYPIFHLTFHTDPVSNNARGEAAYYLDQQDEVNQIHTERARMRHWASTKFLFDTNAVGADNKKVVQELLSSTTKENYFGFDVPADKKIGDIIFPFPVPSTQLEQLFDIRPVMESAGRMSSVSPILQNAQFKTNTTNKAIESYESSNQLRLDEKIDAIEELLGDIAMTLIEMCLQFMPEENVINLIGATVVEEAGGWPEGMDSHALHQDFNLRIIGGSTLKPTSKVKKEQAMQMSQVLGQFAQASPMVVVVMLSMLSRAFADDINITDSEWSGLLGSVKQQVGQQQQQQQQQAQQQGQQQQQQQQSGDGGEELMAKLEAMLQEAPPEARKQVAQAIMQGIPLRQIVAKMMEVAQQVQATQQPQQPQ